MSKLYTYSSWADTFKPTKNHLTNNIDTHFETYDKEYEYVKSVHPNFVWTEVDGDSGTYIIAGLHFVNRIHYYVTENPWDDDMTEVPTWIYRQCDCADLSEDGDYNPDCPECDEGMIDIDCDTVVALKDIYGEDAPIVS